MMEDVRDWSLNFKGKENPMKIIKTVAFTQAATTTTKYEPPDPEDTFTIVSAKVGKNPLIATRGAIW